MRWMWMLHWQHVNLIAVSCNWLLGFSTIPLFSAQFMGLKFYPVKRKKKTKLKYCLKCHSCSFFFHFVPPSAHLTDCLQDVKQSGITLVAGCELKSARWWTFPALKSSSTSPVIKVSHPPPSEQTEKNSLFPLRLSPPLMTQSQSMPEHQLSVTSMSRGTV